jgi:hypothetical protein
MSEHEEPFFHMEYVDYLDLVCGVLETTEHLIERNLPELGLKRIHSLRRCLERCVKRADTLMGINMDYKPRDLGDENDSTVDLGSERKD